jgi:simple sugar transport system permease protein
MSEAQRAGRRPADERVKAIRVRKALIRPELGGIVGTIAVFLFFCIFAGDSGMFNAQGHHELVDRLGAVHDHRGGRLHADDRRRVRPVGGLHDRLCRHVDRDLSVTLGGRSGSRSLTFALCIAIGALNGWIVVRTGLPSFIVTLAFLFILRGFTIFFPQIIERKTIIGGIDDAAEGDWLAPVFGGKILASFLRWLGDAGMIDVFERGSRAGSRWSTAFRC